jgi:hypothetical protein
MKGYQLVEIEFIEKLIDSRELLDIATVTVSWLVNSLREDKELNGLPIEIDFICANYHGNKYPCIGIHYKDVSVGDISHIIETKSKDAIKCASLQGFYDFIFKNKSELIENMDQLR